MKTRIFNLIILDESGSMSCIERQAVSGVNETIQTIRDAREKYADEQEHLLALVTFNTSRIKTLYDCVPIAEACELEEQSYRPACGTPLYDAMGQSLNALRNRVAPADKVLVTIVTDGYENSSVEYSGRAIKALVEKLKAEGWVFAYIGANQDVEAVASSMSIDNTLCFDQSAEGSKRMFNYMSRSRSRWFDRVHDRDENLDQRFFDEDTDHSDSQS